MREDRERCAEADLAGPEGADCRCDQAHCRSCEQCEVVGLLNFIAHALIVTMACNEGSRTCTSPHMVGKLDRASSQVR